METIKSLVEGIPLSTDYLSVRSYNCLRRTGYFYLSEVIDLDRDELLSIKQLGKLSVDEIISLHEKLEKLSRSEVIRYCCGVGEVESDDGELLSITNIISFAKDSLVEASDFVCINDMGVQTEDCDLPVSSFSARTYNALRRANIDTIRELALLSKDSFLKLRGIGKTSYEEVISFIQDRTVIINSSSACFIPEEIYEALAKLCTYFEPCLGNAIGKATKNVLIKQLMDMRSPDGSMHSIDEDVLRKILRTDPIKQLIQKKILQIVGNSIFDYITVNDCKTLLTRVDVIDNDAVELFINELIETNQIKVRNGYLYGTTISFEEWLSSLDDKHRLFITEKCKGKTLEEIGSQAGVTRERVRQVISREISKKPQLLEDGYGPIYSKYSFRDEEFQVLFDVGPEIMGYLGLVYKKGNGGINEFFEDETIPEACHSRSRIAFSTRYLITELGEVIKKNREDLMRWFLKKYYSDKDVIMSDFNSAYTEWLSSYDLDGSEELFYANERSLEANVSRLDFCLLKQGKKIRYYDVKGVDVDKLLNEVQISQYKDCEISTYKLLVDNPDLMQQLDIRDEYELHNILRKHPATIKKYGIKIGRMPIISIGNSDRDKQVRDLLYQFAPIGYYDLALEYEIRFGVRKETVCANFFNNIMVYLDGDTFKVDQPSLSSAEYNRLKESLTEDFYLWKDFAEEFANTIGNNKEELLNPMNIKELGFRLYTQFVIRDNYPTADSYFSALLTSKPVFSLNDFAVGVRSIQAFGNSFRDLRDNLRLIEISKDTFATQEYVCSLLNHCDIDELLVIGRRLSEMKTDDLFSVALSDVTPNINPYIDTINDIYFYNSLIRIQSGIRSAVVSDVCIITRDNREPSTKTILIELLEDNGPLSFDELVELSLAQYGVVTSKYKVSYLLENTDGISVDLVLETACVESKQEETAFWKNSTHENTIIAKYSVLLTSTDRIESVYKLDYFKPFIDYCCDNGLVYMKDLLDISLEGILESLGLSKPVVTEAINLFFYWVDGINNQTAEAKDILDMFFK